MSPVQGHHICAARRNACKKGAIAGCFTGWQGYGDLGVVLRGYDIDGRIGPGDYIPVVINCLKRCVEECPQSIGAFQGPKVRAKIIVYLPIGCDHIGCRDVQSEIIDPARGQGLVFQPVISGVCSHINQVRKVYRSRGIACYINHNILESGRIRDWMKGIGRHADCDRSGQFHGGNSQGPRSTTGISPV